MSGELDSRKDSQSTKFEQRPQIFITLSFRELCDSKLSGLHAFDNMAGHSICCGRGIFKQFLYYLELFNIFEPGFGLNVLVPT